jgi:hypothetical protein
MDEYAILKQTFGERGSMIPLRIMNVNPLGGTTIWATFTSQIKGFVEFPSGNDTGSGTIMHTS